MTAMITDLGVNTPSLRVVSLSRAQQRLLELLSDQRGRAQWWVEVTRYLDELSAGFAESVEDSDNRRGLHEQIRRDAPHLLGRLRRLDDEREMIAEQATSVRLMASRYAGDPLAVSAVARAVRELMWRVRRFHEKTTDMMLDAYSRDIGGE